MIELDSVSYEDEPTRVIRLRVERPDDAQGDLPAVVVLHGFKGFMHWGFFPELSRRIAAAGFVCVSLNASGCGVGEDLETMDDVEGFAKNTLSRELEDLDRARAYAANLEGVDASRLAVFGHSRGGGMALLHAAERGDYRAAVAWAAIDTIDRIDEAAKQAWRETGHLWIPNGRTGQTHRMDLEALHDAEQNAERLDILAACQRLEAPTLVLHGTDDPTVEFAASERIAKALPAPLHVTIEGAGHTFGATHPFTEPTLELERAFDTTVSFLSAHL